MSLLNAEEEYPWRRSCVSGMEDIMSYYLETFHAARSSLLHLRCEGQDAMALKKDGHHIRRRKGMLMKYGELNTIYHEEHGHIEERRMPRYHEEEQCQSGGADFLCCYKADHHHQIIDHGHHHAMRPQVAVRETIKTTKVYRN